MNAGEDYGRAKLDRLADSTLRLVYRNEVAPTPNGKPREWMVDMIVERRRQASCAKGDYRSKFHLALNDLKAAQARVEELSRQLAECEAERRHAVEVRDILLAKLDAAGWGAI